MKVFLYKNGGFGGFNRGYIIPFITFTFLLKTLITLQNLLKKKVNYHLIDNDL